MNKTEFPVEVVYVMVTIIPIAILCLIGLCLRSISNCKQAK